MSQLSDVGKPTISTRDLVRLRDVRTLWIAQMVSDFGDGLTMMALLLLVNELSGSAMALGTLVALIAIPQITIGLVAGVYVDRLDRRKILIFSDLARGALVMGFGIVHSAEQLWIVFALAILQSTAGTFFNPARSAMVQQIVPREGLMAANSLFATTRVICTVMGSAAAAAYIGSLELYWPVFILDGFSFFLAMLLAMRLPTSVADGPNTRSASSVWRELLAGLQVIATERQLLKTSFVFLLLLVSLAGVDVLLVPLIVDDIRIEAVWIGAVKFSHTGGMILGGSVAMLIAARLAPKSVITLGGLIAGLTTLALGAVQNIWQVAAVLFLVGCVVTPMNAAIGTMIQQSVSSSVLGRVGATIGGVFAFGSVVSILLSAALADILGLRPVLFGMGMLAIAGIALGVLMKSSNAVETYVAPEKT